MGTGKKGGGSKGGPPALAVTREYEQSNWNRLQVEGILVLVLSVGKIVLLAKRSQA